MISGAHSLALVAIGLLAAAPSEAAQDSPEAPLPLSAAASEGAPLPTSDDRFGAVPDFTFDSASGGTLSLADMGDKVWVAVPFFVRCAGPCPSITTDIKERLVPALAGTDIKIVSFSLDPEFDTPETMKAYAEGRGIDLTRWHFVASADEEAMHTFIRDGLKVPLQRNEEESAPGLALTHGTRMPVVDPEGNIAGFYEIADPSRVLPDGSSAATPEVAARLLDVRFRLLAARALALAGEPFERRPSPIPLFNAILNGISFTFLVLGIIAIKGGRKRLHAGMMRAAFVASAAFLGFYLYYHFVVQPLSGGPTKFGGTGIAQGLYLAMLLSHIVLAVVNLPMVLRTFWLAHKEDWERHRRLAKWTFPIWLYVSVTGVAVYLALYPFNPA